jgi:hypothetical protein
VPLPDDMNVQIVGIPHSVDVHRDEATLRLSAVFAFRPPRRGVVRDWPRISNWPRELNGLRFELRVSGWDQPQLLTRKSPPADEAIWAALVPPSLEVRPHAAPQSIKTMSYEAGALATALRRRLTRLALTGNDDVRSRSADDDAFDAFHDLTLDVSEEVDVEPHFLERLTRYSEHWMVQRKLGLAVDLEVTIATDKLLQFVARSEELQIRVHPPTSEWANSAWIFYTCRKSTNFKSWLFAPTEPLSVRPHEYLSGFVPLRGRFAYEHKPIDLDVDAAKSQDAADNQTPPRPAFAGVSLVRTARASALDALASHAGAAKTLGAPEPHLDAVHVTRGFRPDVREVDSKRWRSLCRRKGTFTVVDAKGRKFTFDTSGEEGACSTGLTPTQHNKDGASTHKLSPALFRWDGYSLVLPRPWRAPRDGAEKAPSGIAVVFDGTAYDLPRLRFNRAYELRLRTVDMANNSIPDDTANAFTEDDPVERTILFVPRRHDPVAPPLVANSDGLTQRLVLRSWVENGAIERTESAWFHVASPRIAVHLAECHGLFDPNLDDWWDDLSSLDVPLAKGAFKSLKKHDLPPWLTDPLAAGTKLSIDGQSAKVRFSSARKRWKMSVLSLSSGSKLRLRPTGGDFSLEIPAGTSANLAVSSLLDEDLRRHVALFGWMHDADEASLTVTTLPDEHPMVTPPTPVSVVHAVSRPLSAAVLSNTKATRPDGPNSQTATVDGILTCDPTTTGRVIVEARWREPRPLDQWEGREASHVHDVAIAESQKTSMLEFRHDVSDSRHLSVTYTMRAVTRFLSDFPAVAVEKRSIATAIGAIDIEATARPDAPVPGMIAPIFEWTVTPSSTAIRHDRVTIGLRIWLGESWFSSGEGESLALILESLAPKVNGRSDDACRSWWGPDVVRRTGGAPRELTNGDLMPAGNTMTLLAPEGFRVVVREIGVTFEEARKEYHADLFLRASRPIAAPFVRAVVARYQRCSLTDLELSTMVELDPVRLPPQRSVIIETRANMRVIFASLKGESNRDRTDVEFQRVRVRHQAMDVDTWVDVGSPFVIRPKASSDGTDTVEYSAVLTLSRDRLSGDRFLFEEFELFDADAGGTKESLVFSDILLLKELDRR